jgi:hypothetical protein
MGSPLATIFSTPSGSGRCSLVASSHGADSHARHSAGSVGILCGKVCSPKAAVRFAFEKMVSRVSDRPGLSERHVSAGRMKHDPAVRDRQGHAVARLSFCRCLSGKPGAVRSQQVRVGVQRPSTRTACGLQYRSSRQRLLRGQFGKGARRCQAWLSKVRSTRSPQPFHKPKSPNCNEGENENPSARKES